MYGQGEMVAGAEIFQYGAAGTGLIMNGTDGTRTGTTAPVQGRSIATAAAAAIAAIRRSGETGGIIRVFSDAGGVFTLTGVIPFGTFYAA
jgi:hypothetical protein